MKDNSNGVFLPKIFTITFNFFFSSLISSITPEKLLNGPSITLTVSPTMKGMLISSLVLGALAGRKWDQKIKTVIPTMIIGNSVIFAIGLIWLHQYTGHSWLWTFDKGFTPFVFGEILKIAIASTALPAVWKFVSKR